MGVWGTILQDTVERIGGAADGSPRGIVPTIDAQLRWRHVPDSRIGVDDAGRDRTFRTLDPETEENTIAGAAQVQLTWTVPIETQYLPGPGVMDRISSDWVDLVKALQPRSTYPTGLHVRAVEQPEIERDTERDRYVVRFPVRHIYRVAVTLI